MGIFSEWRLFADPEVLLEECINANPFHPFQEMDTDSNAMASQQPQGKKNLKFYGNLFST